MAEQMVVPSVRAWGFRNAMAHYKLGVALKNEELVSEDTMYGLTIKYFGTSYMETRKEIVTELEQLAYQLDGHLQLKK